MSKNTTDELDDILLSHHTCICETDTPTSFRSHQLFCIQNYNDTKKAIQAHIDKKMNKLLDRVESKATEYYDWSKSLEKEVERPFMAVPLERIKKLRSEL